ncbi:MAG: SH3 domain-containing protein [Bacteroidota bacterium]
MEYFTKKITILFFWSLCFFWTCQEKPNTKKVDSQSEQVSAQEVVPPLIFTVNVNRLRLRAEPGDQGKELAKLSAGTTLVDLDQVSDFHTRIKLRGVKYDEPWVKVKTQEGMEGWVFAGGLKFDSTHPGEVPQLLRKKRLQSMFGRQLALAIFQYQEAYANAKNSTTMAKVYTQGRELRDTLVRLLENKILIDDYEQLPDLFWLEEAMPGYVTALVAEGTQYYLFHDYGQMLEKVKATEGGQDDEFAQFCVQVHPMDSIEHFFPAWFMQTWDYGGHSLLGRGIHLDLLKKIEIQLTGNSPFAAELESIKERLLADIIEEYVSYWETQDQITTELTAIVKAELTILDQAQRVALQTRLKMFAQAKANGIKVNQKSGE